MSIGEKITVQRKIRGMSQEALANAMDVTRQAVSRWETGDATPDTDKVIQLSKLFGVSTDYLLLDDIDDPQPAAQTMEAMQMNPANAARIERQRMFRIVFGICVLAIGLACIVTSLVLAWQFTQTTTWFFNELGPFKLGPFGTGLFCTAIAWPFWIGAIMLLGGAAVLVREYLRKD